jgi:hypothetical protein
MAMSEDSRSLLQLLLARGKSYADIAALLDVEDAEVRRRANAALTEIHGSDPDAAAPLTDYLLGQADPIGRADTARILSEDAEVRETAMEISDQLRLLVPGANLPDLSPSARAVVSPSRSRGSATGPAKDSDEGAAGESQDGESRSRNPISALSGTQRRLLGAVIVGALLIGLVAVLIGALGGDDEEGGAQASRPAPTTAVLQPTGDETGTGKVEFGFSGRSLAANLQFNDLKPTTAGNSYTLWLYGPGGAFPLHQTRVTDAGAITGQIAVNEAIICFIAGDLFPDMRLSRVTDAEMRDTLQKARDGQGGGAQGGLPDFVGTTVLAGPISMPQDAKDQILRSCNGAAPATQ